MTTCDFVGGPSDGTCMGVSQDHVIIPENPEPPRLAETAIKDENRATRIAYLRHLYTRSQVRRNLFIYQGLEGQAKQEITWTQYVLPDGRRAQFTMEVPPDVADKAKLLEERGLFLEAEVLRTGQVSLTVADRKEELHADIRLMPNGPAVQEAACDLIRRFDLEGYQPYPAEDAGGNT